MEHFRLIELLNILFPCETEYCTGKWKDINPAGNALCVNLRPAAKKEQAQPEGKKASVHSGKEASFVLPTAG